MTRRALVTGGSGVIGKELVARLVDAGRDVLSVDLVSVSPPVRAGARHIVCDLADAGEAAVRDFDPHEIFHLAASFERTTESPKFWRTNAANNVAASAQVLRGALASPALERYVFASSYLIYDERQYLSTEPRTSAVRLREDSTIRPRNVTGAAKLLHEMELALASSEHAKFSTVSARIYRVFGIGSRDVLSRWVRSALRGELIKAHSTTGRFDYIFASDVAEGLLRLSEVGLEGPVNLGSGRSRTVSEALSILHDHVPGIAVDHEISDGLTEASEADLSLLRSATNWQPETTLEEGLRRIIEFESRAHAVSDTAGG